MIFRFHRETLEEAMKTCVIVEDEWQLKFLLYSSGILSWHINPLPSFSEIEPYMKLYITHQMFDKRIGWDSHYVSLEIEKFGYKKMIEGMLSGAFSKGDEQ